MDWKRLFLSADGRIGRQEFWIGFAILFGVGLVLNFVPILGQLISLALIYCWVCVYSKRLHDFGKSGWLQLIPYGVGILAGIIGVTALGGSAAIAALSGANDDAVAGSAIAGLGMFGLLMALAGLVGLGFLLWVGISPSDPGANRYGPSSGQPSTEVFS